MNAPRIPASTSYSSNFTRELEVSSIICTSITDNIATLSNGTLSNLNDPINNQDAATKHYTDSILHTVAEPNTSVQYNNNGSFGGSTSLTFSTESGGLTLFSNNTIIGTGSNMLTINSGHIYNVGNPSTTSSTPSNNAISKEYFDNYFILRVYTSSDAALTYPSEYLTNAIVIRNTSTGSDSTATASDIISYIATTYGSISDSSFRLCIKNYHTQDTLSLTAGTNVSFYPTTSSINIYAGYSLNATLKTSITTTSASILVTGLSWLPSTTSGSISNNNFIVGYRSNEASANITRISNKFNFNTNVTEITEQNFIYTAEYLTGIVYRNFNGVKEDTFGDVSLFISSYSAINSPIDYIFTTGAVEIVIKNTSTTGSLSLVGNDFWTMDPNSNMTIGTGKTGYFYLYIDTTNLLGYIYTIGILDP
jgi:hypothetical protein